MITVRNCNVNHTTYGGELSAFDFEGHHTLTSIATKISRDLRFDEKCRKNTENRKEVNHD